MCLLCLCKAWLIENQGQLLFSLLDLINHWLDAMTSCGTVTALSANMSQIRTWRCVQLKSSYQTKSQTAYVMIYTGLDSRFHLEGWFRSSGGLVCLYTWRRHAKAHRVTKKNCDHDDETVVKEERIVITATCQQKVPGTLLFLCKSYKLYGESKKTQNRWVCIVLVYSVFPYGLVSWMSKQLFGTQTVWAWPAEFVFCNVPHHVLCNVMES